MKIIVTGSSGFIGFHVSKKLLESGKKVHGVDSMNNYYDINLKKNRIKSLLKNKKFKFLKKDICNFSDLDKLIKLNKIKIVIHYLPHKMQFYFLNRKNHHNQINRLNLVG